MTPFDRHIRQMLKEQEKKGIRRSAFHVGKFKRNRKINIECGKI